jgi:hypothetical protein
VSEKRQLPTGDRAGKTALQLRQIEVLILSWIGNLGEARWSGAKAVFGRLQIRQPAMTTQTKLAVAGFTACAMMLLNVFSKPLHIPEAFQWVLVIGVFIPLGLVFYFIKRQKFEKLKQAASGEAAVGSAADERQIIRRRLLLIMVVGSAAGLCSPLWMPFTGTTLGTRGDFICGVITAAIVCTIVGLRLRKI